MKYTCLFFLCIISLNLQANTEQPPKNETNPEIDRLFDRYNEQIKADTSRQQENIKKSTKSRFTPEFIQILLSAAPKQLKDKLVLLQSPHCPEDKKPRLLLLYGPSGSGKTTLLELLAELTQRQYIPIKAANLGNELVNSHQTNFKMSIEPYLDKPCLIGLDELDAVIKESTSAHDPERKLPQQFWSLLDELIKNHDVIIAGTTNDIGNLPTQIKTRFADALIEIPTPKVDIKKEIFSYYIKQYPNDCDDNFLNSLANNCKELSIREIEKAVNNAWSKAFLRNSTAIFISKKDLEESVKDLKATIATMTKASEEDQQTKTLKAQEAAAKVGVAAGYAGIGLFAADTGVKATYGSWENAAKKWELDKKLESAFKKGFQGAAYLATVAAKKYMGERIPSFTEFVKEMPINSNEN